MNRRQPLFFLFLADLLVASLLPAVAVSEPRSASKTVVLDVQNMTCFLCPYTVKKSLVKVPGVKSASVDYDSRTATVVFDPGKTGVAELTAATTNAGYPSTPRP